METWLLSEVGEAEGIQNGAKTNEYYAALIYVTIVTWRMSIYDCRQVRRPNMTRYLKDYTLSMACYLEIKLDRYVWAMYTYKYSHLLNFMQIGLLLS